MQKMKYWLILAVFIIIFRSDLLAVTFYLSPDGNDTWSGRLESTNKEKTDGPLLTLCGARDKIRLLKSKGLLTEPVYVRIKSGCYQMTEPLVFTPEDSGTAKCPVFYEAIGHDSPVFSGGYVVKNFKQNAEGLWVTTVPKLNDKKINFNQLFVNGKRAIRARTPNNGYFYLAGKCEEGVNPESGQIEDLTWRAFKVYPQELNIVKNLNREELRESVVVLYHSWEVDRLKIDAINQQDNALLLQGSITWKLQHFGGNQRYHLENFKQALDQEGEWFCDLNDILYYKPLPSENIADSELVVPVIKEFIRFEGDYENGKYVERIYIKGLSFKYADYELSEKGSFNVQGADFADAAIMADGVKNIIFENCEIAHTGNHAIWLRHGCLNNVVEKCYLHDLGGGGVRIGQCWLLDEEFKRSNPNPSEQQYSGYNRLENNIIRSGGQVFMGANGILIGHSGNNQILHNDICDFCHSGISVGWRWDYKPSVAVNNIVEYNHIHHLGRNILSDFGGVYTLGVSNGTKIKNNFIHDLFPYNLYGLGGYGIYNDQGSSYILIENNLVVNAVDGGYFCNAGKENIIRNNIFVNSQRNQLSFCKAEDHLSFNFRNNIVYFESGQLLKGWSKSWFKGNLCLDNNIYYSPAEFNFAGESFAQWKKRGNDENSKLIDPCFVDLKNGNYHINSKSPAFEMGFKAFNYKKAGVYGDSQWSELAKVPCNVPKTKAFIPGMPIPFFESFEEVKTGAKPENCTIVCEGKSNITITNDKAVDGDNSLKIDDVKGLENSWDPHIFWIFQGQPGILHCIFYANVERGGYLLCELRNENLTGPSFAINNGEIEANDRVICQVPIDKWVQYEVVSNAGDEWDLIVRVPGKESQSFENLKTVSSQWSSLRKLIFASLADEKTTVYLDDIKVFVE